MNISTLFSQPKFTCFADYSHNSKLFKRMLSHDKNYLIYLLNNCALEPSSAVDLFFTVNEFEINKKNEYSISQFNRDDVLIFSFSFFGFHEKISLFTSDNEFINQLKTSIKENFKLPLSLELKETNQYKNSLIDRVKSNLGIRSNLLTYNEYKTDIQTELAKYGFNQDIYTVFKNDYSYPQIPNELKIKNSEAFSRAIEYQKKLAEEFRNKKIYFEIPDKNSMKKSFSELHVWKWLNENYGSKNLSKYNSINTKLEYLQHIGYNAEEHKLLEEDITLLKNTIKYHFSESLKIN